MNIIDIIYETQKNKKIIYDLLKTLYCEFDYEKESIIKEYEPYILDSFLKLNSQLDKIYNNKKKDLTQLQSINFLSINYDLYNDYINKKIDIEDYTNFNNIEMKVCDCLLIKNIIKVDILALKTLIMTELN